MKIRKTLIAVCGMLLAAGCQNTVNTVENTNKAAAPNVIQDSRFTTDKALEKRLALTNLKTSTSASGCLQFQIEATNLRTGFWAQTWSKMTSDNPYRVLYKVDWFDAKGMSMPGILSDWKNLTIIPGETVYIRGIAPTLDCKDFKVSIKEAE